jgi:hypothetical protein
MTSDERLKLIEEHEQLNVELHLEIESFYTFATTVLDDAARLIELFFGRIPAKPLSSHDDLTRRLHNYQQEKALELPAGFNDAVTELRRDISDFRDRAVAHEQCPRTMYRTTWTNGESPLLELSRIHPKASDRDQTSGDINELIRRLHDYLSMVLTLLANSFDRSTLRFADA